MEKHEDPDVFDAQVLRHSIYTYENVVDYLNTALDETNTCRMLLIDNMVKYPEIKDELSFENKLIKLRRLDTTKEMRKLIHDYFTASTKVKTLKNKKDMLQEKINGIKKVMDITPR